MCVNTRVKLPSTFSGNFPTYNTYSLSLLLLLSLLLSFLLEMGKLRSAGIGSDTRVFVDFFAPGAKRPKNG
jgi:hypothetical protein